MKFNDTDFNAEALKVMSKERFMEELVDVWKDDPKRESKLNDVYVKIGGIDSIKKTKKVEVVSE